MQKIGQVLSSRWVASSVRSVNAILISYSALAKHFSDASEDICITGSKRAMYKGLRGILRSYQFVKSLTLLDDALREVSVLSLAFKVSQSALVKPTAS